tara:strand:+ start:67847 stop:68794 length:948 start_codon:yes stop_codon:yes gene_type:complete
MYGDTLPMKLAPKHACHISLNNGLSTCSGTMMSPTIIKTASHCLRSQKVEEVSVHCPNGQSFKAKELILHPDYSKVRNKMMADVGLIKLEGAYQDKIPAYLDQRKQIEDLMKNSPLCAVWGYGFHIENLQKLGVYHGVKITSYFLDESHIQLDDMKRVMIRSGDSGGGLFCLDGNRDWINVATVYGHDFENSFLLRNDYIKNFLDDNQLQASQANIEQADDIKVSIKRSIVKLEIGKTYKVKPFSVFHQENGDILGTGDQRNVDFIVNEIQESKVIGKLIINDLSPLRYLCWDGIACYGEYEKVELSSERLLLLE